MKKLLFLSLLLVAVSVFGQEFTFQGLPWGSTREQVIEKLGKPVFGNDDLFFYDVSFFGYLSRLDIGFDSNGMCWSSYNVGQGQRINIDLLAIAFIIVAEQLVEKYGTYHEIIIRGPTTRNDTERELVWHFEDFHIIINTITNNSNSLNVSYCSDLTWRSIEEELKTERVMRFPNGGL